MQRLIVEGKDDKIVVSTIIKKKKMLPEDYTPVGKLDNEFIKEAGGYSGIKLALNEQLDTPDVARIGIIVDADNKDVESRLRSLLDFIEKKIGVNLPKAELTEKGFGYQFMDSLYIGIWVMPDNKNEGYLENFIGSMIPEDDKTWQFAQAKVQELSEQDFCKFTKVKTQKALVHTYLAWQKSPGTQMGRAINANFLNIETPLIENFTDWFKNTFTLEQSS